MSKSILLINGPNINLLGLREPAIYGSTTFVQLVDRLHKVAASHDITLTSFQSNHEGEIIEQIHKCMTDPDFKVDGIIINPGAYTHTSVGIRDAFLSVDKPFVEIHVTNVHAREEFRRHSYLSDKAQAVICGLGVFGYVAALEWWAWKLNGGKIEEAGVAKD